MLHSPILFATSESSIARRRSFAARIVPPANPNHPQLTVTESTLIVELRSATASLHAAVERLPVMIAITAAAVTYDDYLNYLARMTEVYGSLEPPLLSILDTALLSYPDLRPDVRPKLPSLLADLAAHGAEPPRPVEPLEPEDLSTAIGGIYVLEGATLGARVIAKHLCRQLGGEAAERIAADAFLGLRQEAGRPSVSSSWKAFAAQLERLATRGFVDRQQATRGARTTFERVHRVLGGRTDPQPT